MFYEKEIICHNYNNILLICLNEHVYYPCGSHNQINEHCISFFYKGFSYILKIFPKKKMNRFFFFLVCLFWF